MIAIQITVTIALLILAYFLGQRSAYAHVARLEEELTELQEAYAQVLLDLTDKNF